MSGLNGVFRGNETNNNVNRGISASSATNTKIIDNSASGNGFAGIFLSSGSSNVVISGNTVTGTSSWPEIGIGVDADGNFITGNTSDSNGRAGISIFGDDNEVTGNYIRMNGRDGIEKQSGSRNIITGNYSDDNNRAGIYINNNGSDDVVETNTLKRNTTGINIRAIRTIVSLNTVLDSKSIGIFATGLGGSQIIGNTITNSANVDAEDRTEPFARRFATILNTWSGNICDTSNPIGLCGEVIFDLVVTSDGSGRGIVRSVPSGIHCVGECIATFLEGTVVTVFAERADVFESVFIGWSGDCSGAGNCVVTMDQNRTVNATFDLDQQPPPEAIATLIEDVEDLNLANGLEKALTAKLNAALAALDRGQDNTAINNLEAFINLVEAQSGKKIDVGDAQDLIDAAIEIITTIQEGG